MTVQCTNCDKRATNKTKLRQIGCLCDSEPITVTDEKDHMEFDD